MKNFITLILLCFSLASFAQTEKKVEKNDQKIDELNKRLDNLIGGTKSISGDSLEYKIDILFNEIKTIKTEIRSLQQSVDELNSPTNKIKLDKINSKITDLESGEYYVVIASALNDKRAKNLERVYSKNYSVRLVNNSKGTWYHIILDETFSISEAIKKVNEFKSSKFDDAWWVTGRKLKDI